MSEYTRQVLRVVVAKICQTIGWHSINSTPLEIMVDLLRRYFIELTRLTHSYATQCKVLKYQQSRTKIDIFCFQLDTLNLT